MEPCFSLKVSTRWKIFQNVSKHATIWKQKIQKLMSLHLHPVFFYYVFFFCRWLESWHHKVRVRSSLQIQKGSPYCGLNPDLRVSHVGPTSTSHSFMLHQGPPHPPQDVQLPSQTTFLPKGFGNAEPATCFHLVCQKNLIFNPQPRFFILGSTQPQSSELWGTFCTSGKDLPVWVRLEPWAAFSHHTLKGLNSILCKRLVFVCTDEVIV